MMIYVNCLWLLADVEVQFHVITTIVKRRPACLSTMVVAMVTKTDLKHKRTVRRRVLQVRVAFRAAVY